MEAMSKAAKLDETTFPELLPVVAVAAVAVGLLVVEAALVILTLETPMAVIFLGFKHEVRVLLPLRRALTMFPVLVSFAARAAVRGTPVIKTAML